MSRNAKLMVTCCLVVASVFPISSGSALPGDVIAGNDNFSDAVEFTTLPYQARPTGRLATSEVGERAGCLGDPAVTTETVWYRYAPATHVPYVWIQEPAGFVAVAVYTGNTLSDLTLIVCDPGWLNSGWVLYAQPSSTYYIQLIRAVEAGPLYGDQLRADIRAISTLRGRITDESGNAIETCVGLLDLEGAIVRQSNSNVVDGDGRYAFWDIPAGDFKVRFGCDHGPWTPEYFDDKSTFADATPVSVTPGATIEGIDAALTPR